MQIKINVLTKIEDADKSTFYFIHNESKTVLPLEFNNLRDISTEDTYVRTLKALKVYIQSVNIYLYLEGIYYVYLKIPYNGNTFDINTSLSNALCILNYLPETEVYIENEILQQEGIKITKEMLEQSNLIG